MLISPKQRTESKKKHTLFNWIVSFKLQIYGRNRRKTFRTKNETRNKKFVE